MQIEIHTSEKNLSSELFETPNLTAGNEFQITDDVKVVFQRIENVNSMEIIFFDAIIGGGPITAVRLANWLYSKLQGKNIEKLVINGKKVEIDRGKLARAMKGQK
ncbi:MAG: hypothetical protein ACFFCZ_20580 [Promethearchaeota archaeon]